MRAAARPAARVASRYLSTAAVPETTPLPVDLYGDDVLNDLLAPSVQQEMAVGGVGVRGMGASEDAFLYASRDSAAVARQVALEEQTVDVAVERYLKLREDAKKRGDVWVSSAQGCLLAWFGPLVLEIEKEREAAGKLSGRKSGRKRRNSRGDLARNVSGRIPVGEEVAHLMNLLSSEASAAIAIHTVLAQLMKEAHGSPVTRLALAVGNSVRAEINLKKIGALKKKQEHVEATQGDEGLLDTDGTGAFLDAAARRPMTKGRGRHLSARSVLVNAMSSSSSVISAVNYAAAQSAVRNAVWTDRELLLVGTKLMDMLVRTAKVEDGAGNFVQAFVHFRKFRRTDLAKVGMLQLSEATAKVLAEDGRDLEGCISPKQQPMLVRPRPWISPTNGAYIRTPVSLIRAPPSAALENALEAADLSVLYDGLNALGDTAWRVNNSVLDVAKEIWHRGGGTAGLPSKQNVPVPERAQFVAEAKAKLELELASKRAEDPTNVLDTADGARGLAVAMELASVAADESHAEEKELQQDALILRRFRHAKRKAQKANRELFSMRADTQHKLDQAGAFANEERLWLPHNVDFRGRAYPIPVYLQHMGCDLTRSMLAFASPGVELGPRGLYWLKVHLANLLGADKLPYAERVAVAEDSLPRALEVARNPLSDKNMEWWTKQEDPFQLLAACSELSLAAGRYGGEMSMESFHSTLPVSMDGSCNGLQHYAALGRDLLGGEQVNLTPNDRPQDVYSGVATLVNERVNAAAEDGDEIAQVLKGKITRKVVKQTVMTSVYGVTIIGARSQICNRLAEIEGFPENMLFPASMMLASLTLSSLGDIFSGATRTMDWLYAAATSIAKKGHEVQWITPVGLPVIQPYRKKARVMVRTLMQRVVLEQHGDHVPVSSVRQRSAFAPNFVHSIDSSHMLLTAIACEKAGMNFAAVHDSFWTNAATVDEMNTLLRQEFVKLHSRDLLSELREGFLLQFPDIKFSEVPARGELNLEVVRESPYFFS